MRLKVIAIVLLLAVGGGAAFVAMGGIQPSTTAATTLLTATASVADVTDEIAATGTVQAVNQYALWFGADAVTLAGDADASNAASSGNETAAGVRWNVTAVNVTAGVLVKAGDVLATAADEDLEAQIAEANRNAKAADLQLKVATTNREEATTTAAKRQTQIALYSAQSQDSKAKADLAALVALRDHTTIVAPADGVVTSVNIMAGTDAPASAAITLSSSAQEVVTSVVESDVAAIQLGQAATVDVAALDASLRGTVSHIDPVGSGSGQNGVVAFAVDIVLDAPPGGLRPGMSAEITITAASATNVVSIPSRALSGSAGIYTVRVVAADGSLTTRQVEVGLLTSSLAEIKSGLQAGEVVVTGTSSTQNGANGPNGGPGFLPGGGGGTVIRGIGQ